MGAAIGWTNLVALDLDLALAVSHTMTSATFDTAYPAANGVTADPSKFTRLNVVNSVGSNQSASFRSVFSTANDKSIRVLAALNVRVPSNTVSVALTALNAANASLETITIAYANLVPIPGTTDRFNILACLAATQAGAGAQFTVTLPTGSIAYLDCGLLWASDALIFDEGAYKNWTMGVIDPSNMERSRGGALISTKMPHRRTMQINFDNKTYNAAMGVPGTAATLSMRKMLSEVGLSSPCVVLPRTPVSAGSPSAEETHALQSMGLYASFTGQQNIGHAGGNLFQSSLNFEEIR